MRAPDERALALARAHDQALSQPEQGRWPAPAQRARFRDWQLELAQARSGRELLDRLISPADAPRLVPMLPVEDLHRAIHRIGLEDCTELLTMVSGEQVRGLLDLDAWHRDELQVERVDPWLHALMEAGPEVLGQAVLALDDEVINWIVRRSVEAIVIEEPDDFEVPETGESVMTPDGRLCIHFPDPTERDLPVKIFLDWLMRRHPVYCVDLLIGSSAALDGVLQEEAYRWRAGRMADRGYVDPHEAQVIYTPPPPGAVPAAAATDDAPAPRHWLASVVDPEARLAAALGALDHEALLRVEQQLAHAANLAIAADWLEPFDFEGQKATLRRLRAGLVVGLDGLGGRDARTDARLLAERGPALVFRAGHARILAAAEPLRRRDTRARLRSLGDPLGALDVESWRAWGEALLARHPSLPGGHPIEARHLAEVTLRARALAELAHRAAGRPDEVGIGAWITTHFARARLGLTGDGPLPAEHFVAAVRAVWGEGSGDAADAWWQASDDSDAARALWRVALFERAATVDLAEPDPRQVPWIVLG